MKKLLLALLASMLTKGAYGQTAYIPPLPEQFSGMTNVEDHQSFRPAAIYRVRGDKMGFACMGTIYPSAPGEMSVVLPEHLFSKYGFGPTEVYGVRSARPDSVGFIGFINRITSTSKNWSGCDMATAIVGTNRVLMTNFSDLSEGTPVLFVPSETVMMRGMETKEIHSHITGKQVRILGYGITPSKELAEQSKDPKNWDKTVSVKDEHPYIVVDLKGGPGSSGHPFYDEHGRLFIAEGVSNLGNAANDPCLKQINQYSLQKYGKAVGGIMFLTGPMTFDH